MTQLVCWVVFPLVLAALVLGCGLLLERATGQALPEGLLLPAGLAVIVVAAEILTKLNATAKFTTPAVVALAVAGVAIGRPWRRGWPLGRWAVAAAIAVYVAYLAPVLLSGHATFTGYIKLDDTATWMAMVDRVLSHGHDLSGLAPSTYETTLHFYLTGGEPAGALLPWGIGHQLVGEDVAWVFQPYLAFLGAMLSLSLWALIGPLVRSRPLRAVIVFVAAQSALIYGYSLWGGIKEVAAAWLLALTAGCAVSVFEGRARVRSFLPLGAASLAMLGVLDYGGAVWLAVVLVAVALFALRIWLRTSSPTRAIALLGAAALVAFAVIRGAQGFVNANGALTTSELANLIHALSWRQLFGIWPAGDFRVDPSSAIALTDVLIGVVIAAACVGLVAAWTRRWWPLWLYVAGAMIGVLLVSTKGSPWVQGKALATASPAMLLAALIAAMLLIEHPRGSTPVDEGRRSGWVVLGRRVVGVAASVAIAFGVLWSNVLAYHQVTLAPFGQFAELEQIGNRFAGQGPTLINEFQPYGARHFLRNMDPESPSELRRRQIPLRSGQLVPTGGYADLNDLQLQGILIYRTLVLRNSPVASRPPAPYRLVFNGRWYQVWQRPTAPARPVIAHLPLSNGNDPDGVPPCGRVLGLARSAGRDGMLAAASRPAPAVVASVPSPLPTGTTTSRVVITKPGVYDIWLEGSFYRRLTTYVDRARVGSAREQINEAGQWTKLATVKLGASVHTIGLSYGGAELAPGSGVPGRAGPDLNVGPLAVAAAAGYPPIQYVPPSDARALCGKPWNWIEALGP